MIPAFQTDGNLPPGIHWTTWDEVVERFGYTAIRRERLDSLRTALYQLRRAGCPTAYLDGSFVTAKPNPADYDVCWEEAGVEFYALDPALLIFDEGRVTQKHRFGGELFPAHAQATPGGTKFLDFFQQDKITSAPKGIIALDLRGLP